MMKRLFLWLFPEIFVAQGVDLIGEPGEFLLFIISYTDENATGQKILHRKHREKHCAFPGVGIVNCG